MRLATLGQLAGALGVGVAELLGQPGGPEPASPRAERNRELGARELLAGYGISPRELEAILAGVPGPSGAVPAYRLLEFVTGEIRALRADVSALTRAVTVTLPAGTEVR